MTAPQPETATKTAKLWSSLRATSSFFFPFGQSSSLLILGEDGWKSSYGVRTWLEAIVLIVLIILI